MLVQNASPDVVVCVIGIMGVAVNLDHELRIVRGEIGNVWPDDLLAPELDPHEPRGAQFQPHAQGRLRHGLAVFAGKAGKPSVAQSPSPNPLP